MFGGAPHPLASSRRVPPPEKTRGFTCTSPDTNLIMITGAPTATMLLALSSTARAFVRPVGPAALSGARWAKGSGASQVRSLMLPV